MDLPASVAALGEQLDGAGEIVPDHAGIPPARQSPKSNLMRNAKQEGTAFPSSVVAR